MPISTKLAASRRADHDRRRAAAAAVVPEGPYCYVPKEYDPATGRLRIAACPFWKRRTDWPEWHDGYCRLLKAGDHTEGRRPDGTSRSTLALWDMLKECGINPGADDDAAASGGEAPEAVAAARA